MQLVSTRRTKAASRFIALLLEDRFLLRALIENESLHREGNVGAAIECIFYAEGQDVDLLKLTMPKAVESTSEAELLFRQDSIYTDIANRFLRFHGAKYLRKALKAPLAAVLQRAKAGEEFALDAGAAAAERVTNAAEEVLRGILAKAVAMPSEIRAAIAALVDATEAKFGSSKRGVALVGFFWLRFVCPAIVSPFKAGVIKSSTPPSEEAIRALLAVSKVVKACVDGQVSEKMGESAAGQVRELSAKWRPRIDASFLELRQPARFTPQRGQHDDGIFAAVSLLGTLQKQQAALSAALSAYGASGTVAALEKILEQFEGDKDKKKDKAAKRDAKTDTLLDAWTNEHVLSWLDMLGLAHHKPAFAKRGVTGKTLATLDAPALVLMGVEAEEEQWLVIRSVRDVATLRQRYRAAAAAAERRGGSAIGSLVESSHSTASLDEPSCDDDESSCSSTASGSSAGSSARVMPRRGSGLVPTEARRSSAPVLAPAEQSQLPSACLFKVSRGVSGIRIVRANRSDPLRTLQAAIERELCVPAASLTLTYMNADQKATPIASDADLQHFLATQATVTKNDLGATAVYRLYVN